MVVADLRCSFCRCLADGAADQDFHAPCPAEFPFIVSLADRPGRLSAMLCAPHIITSDELCLELSRLGDDWAFRPLVSEEVVDASSLMKLRVVGSGADLPEGEACASSAA